MTPNEQNRNRFRRIAVVGGDLRQLIAARELAAQGYSVCVSAIDTYDGNYGDFSRPVPLETAVCDCDVILLPLPVTRNGGSLHAPLTRESIPLPVFFDTVAKTKNKPLMLGGRVGESLATLARRYGFTLLDYYAREELQILNAIPTAEGAIALAMNRCPYTLQGSRCTVLGFGRVGKVLSKMLAALGADVTVVARKESDRAWANTLGCRAVSFDEIDTALKNCRIVYNTVPQPIITAQQLASLPRDAVLIDLASARGIDEHDAREHGNELIWALSLPGKIAPATAGSIIKQSVMHVLEEQSMKETEDLS